MNLTRRHLTLIAIIGVLIALVGVAGLTLDRGGGGGDEAGGGAALGYASVSDTEPGVAELLRDGREEAYSVAASGPAAEDQAGQPADVASGAPPAPDPKLQGLLDRKIVQSSSVDLDVEEVGHSFQEIIRFATTAGGFVASSSFSNVEDDQIADLTIRVPGDKYQDVLGQIRGLGEVQTESSDASDVTEEYTDLQARLRTLEAAEQRYLELLARAETINDILTVQDRLDAVRGQIEQVQGRINLLDHLTELATITVHLRPLAAAAEPPADGGPHPLEAAENAWESSLDALRGLAAAVLVVGVFSWWLLPPLAALGLGARWWLGRRPRAAAEVSTS